ncbi:dynamin family protein [Brachyspira intermedia]|uniref:dynamin family protein n=1 Tax=Brachyspira intermedia TaxID=84377 RepID=UPI003007A565
MKEIYFEYNPFTLEYILKDNGEKFDSKSKIYEYINGNKRLQFWLDKLIPLLYEHINDNFNLTFKGTVLDYEDLKLEVDHFNNENKTNITLVHKPVRSVDDRLKELKSLFVYMIDTTPFEELKEQKFLNQLNESITKEVEIAVIATMSSGKSTLLNSFLGRELMPSKNQACTATIARIKDVDNMEGTSVICRDADENIVIDEVSNVTVENIKEFNDNENVSYIDIKTDIPFVSSHNLGLVLLDTPGPNNSRDERHKEKTYKVINESDPLVLYVLNATQLSTNDDNLLLSYILKAMEKAGKQAKDRFLFVANKLDNFDLEEGDSIEKVYEDVISYLKSHKIENPNIYFISAQAALITRLIKNNYELSRKQKYEFETIKSLSEKFDEFIYLNMLHFQRAGMIK